jgi:anti-sigma B factor antagonist
MAANPSIPYPELQIEKETTSSETIFRCEGKITSSTSPLLQSTVQIAIPEKKSIVLDLSNVAYMDRSGLGTLVALWTSAKRAACELQFVSLCHKISR